MHHKPSFRGDIIGFARNAKPMMSNPESRSFYHLSIPGSTAQERGRPGMTED
jgi:hypothetical protein